MKNNPYVGPKPYEVEDRNNFFGRNREARELRALIVANREVLFYAQSGAGKTSLINAQVIPALKDKGFRVPPPVRVGSALPPHISLSNGDNVFVFSTLVMLDSNDSDPQSLLQHTLHSFLEQHYPAQADQGHTFEPLVLIFDQFEELFTTHGDRWQDARSFFQQIREALDKRPDLGVVFAMRQDHVAEIDPYVSFFPRRLRTRFHMERLGIKGALAAITRPAENAGCHYDPGVAEKLVDNLRQIRVQHRLPQDDDRAAPLGPYVEPVQLQVVCHRLWENLPEQEDSAIQWHEVEQYGNVDRALRNFYDSALAAALAQNQVDEYQLRHWFQEQLITQAETRGLVLYGAQETGDLPNATVDVLEAQHIIRADVRAGARWVELVHDRLVDPILQANEEWHQAHPLIQAAREWQASGQPESKLYQGEQLADAGRDQDADLELVRTFLQAGREAQESRKADILAEEQAKRVAEQARANRRWRGLVGVLVVVFMLAVGSAVVAMTQTRLATRSEAAALAAATAEAQARQEAEAQEALAVELFKQADYQRQLSLVKSLAASASSTADSELATLLSVEAFHVNNRIAGTDAWLVDGALRSVLSRPFFNNTLSHDDVVSSATFDPNTRWLASASEDGTIYFWDMADLSATPRSLQAHTAAVTSITFSDDGRWLASGSEDETVRLWDLGGLLGAEPGNLDIEPLVLESHAHGTYAVAFGPNGRWLASGGADEAVHLWDLATMRGTGSANSNVAPLVLEGHIDLVYTVAFDPTGRRLASGSGDETILLWDLENLDDQPFLLEGHTDMVRAIAFGPNGQWLASAGNDRTVQLWDISTLEMVHTFSGHRGTIYALRFSPEGRWLASGSDDRTVRLWDMDNWDAAPYVLQGHTDTIWSTTLSANGQWLASGSSDRTIRLWDVSELTELLAPGGSPNAKPRVFREDEAGALSVAFSPDGQWLASGSEDNLIRVWNLNEASDSVDTGPHLLRGHTDFVNSVAFDPKGQWLASGSDDMTVRMWSLKAPNAAPLVFTGHEDWVNAVTFSADGRWLASGSDDSTIHIWDMIKSADSPDPAQRVLTGHELGITSLAFSPDGQWLASGSDDGTTRIWDMEAPDVSHLVFSDQMSGIVSVTFSPDRKWLFSASDDGTIRTWDRAELVASTNAAPRVFAKHESWVTSMALSPDGRWLASGSEDRTIRLWDLSEWTNSPQANESPLQAPRLLSGHEDWVNAIAFSQDGRWLASGSYDSTVRVWLAGLDELAEAGCTKVSRNLTRAEWTQYLPGEDYRATCPNLPVPPEE